MSSGRQLLSHGSPRRASTPSGRARATLASRYNLSDLSLARPPTAGNGNLLVGALIAGFKPENVYGNELDPDIYEMLVTRLAKYGVPKKNLVNMDCLSDDFKEWCNVI